MIVGEGMQDPAQRPRELRLREPNVHGASRRANPNARHAFSWLTHQRSCKASSPNSIPNGSITRRFGPASTTPATHAFTP